MDCEQEEALEDQLNAAHNQARQIVASLIHFVESNSPPPNSAAQHELQARYVEVRHQLVALERKLLTFKSDNVKLQAALSELKEENSNLFRSLKRQESKTWQIAFQKHAEPPAASTAPTPIKKAAVPEQVHVTSLEPTSIRKGLTLADLEALASEERSKELLSLRNELATLKSERDTLAAKISAGPDELVVMAHPSIRNLKEDCTNRTREVGHWKRRTEALQAELQQVRDSHSTWVCAHKEAISAMESGAEQDVKKIAEELARVRRQRDELSQAREQLLTERSTKIHAVDALKTQLEVKEARLSSVSAQLSRLLVQDLVSTGHPFIAREMGASADLIATIDLKLKSMQKTIDVSSKENNGSGDAEVPQEESKQSLQAQLEVARSQVEMLTNEMNSVAEGYARLDAAVGTHVATITSKEDQIQRLIADKTKLDGKILFLRKQCEQLKMEADAARKIADVAREALRASEERERSALALTVAAQREATAAGEASAASSQFALEREKSFLASQISVKNAEARIQALSSTLETRNSELEIARHERNRAQERVSQLNAILAERERDHEQQASSNNIEEASDLASQYRQLLLCGACRTRFKDTAILRCMHTFCRQCVTDRLETRQRKCPTCGDPFAQSDVRTIYI
jgi:chromosome segregation ATPase